MWDDMPRAMSQVFPPPPKADTQRAVKVALAQALQVWFLRWRRSILRTEICGCAGRRFDSRFSWPRSAAALANCRIEIGAAWEAPIGRPKEPEETQAWQVINPKNLDGAKASAHLGDFCVSVSSSVLSFTSLYFAVWWLELCVCAGVFATSLSKVPGQLTRQKLFVKKESLRLSLLGQNFLSTSLSKTVCQLTCHLWLLPDSAIQVKAPVNLLNWMNL